LVDQRELLADHPLVADAGTGQRLALDPGQEGERGSLELDQRRPVEGWHWRARGDAGRLEHRGD